MGTALPGFDAPAVGFEAPYEMLAACHERVQRSLDLLGRLVDYIGKQGHDAQTRSAAADVLRYFDLAAPLHHQDEEQHVFPLLLTQGDVSLRATVQRLQADHRQMEALWADAREALLRWSEPDCQEQISADTRETIARFRGLYAGHIQAEEGQVFPAAHAAMSAATLGAMGAEMQARRRT
ncbi:MAG: hemerythrin domain-containing protein [Burkholderiales bacterium]|nr:hemerythrin domain-containing protein [Burkholderiales bacterium]